MITLLHAISRSHRFCINHLIYPLVLSSGFACTLFVGRVVINLSLKFDFLVWNLMLAWIPFLITLLIAQLHSRYPRRWWLLVIPSIVWIVFLPNAPYLLTDLWHLQEYRPAPMWYDIGMLASFAWTGCFLGVASLNEMHRVVRHYWGGLLSWVFVFGVIGLSALGVYVGRFLRWNSWDLLTDPHNIALDLGAQFAHPIRNAGPFGFTFLFAAFLFVCYLMFFSIEHRQTVK